MFIWGEVIPTVTVCPGMAQAAQAPGRSGLEPRRRARRAQACIGACQRVPRPDGDGCDKGKQNRVLDGRQACLVINECGKGCEHCCVPPDGAMAPERASTYAGLVSGWHITEAKGSNLHGS